MQHLNRIKGSGVGIISLILLFSIVACTLGDIGQTTNLQATVDAAVAGTTQAQQNLQATIEAAIEATRQASAITQPTSTLSPVEPTPTTTTEMPLNFCNNCTITIEAGKSFELQYGYWRLRGAELIEDNQKHLAVKLFIGDREINGGVQQLTSCKDDDSNENCNNGEYIINYIVQVDPLERGIYYAKAVYVFDKRITDGYKTGSDDELDYYGPGEVETVEMTIIAADYPGRVRHFEGHEGPVESVAFSPDGKLLATGGGRDGMVRLWNVATGQETRRFEGGGDPPFFSPELSFSPDGELLVASDEGTVRLWNVTTGQEIHRFDTVEEAYSIASVPDGKLLVTYGTSVRLWDVTTGQEIRHFGEEDDKFPHHIALSPDGKLLAAADRDAVRLWDVKTGQKIRGFAAHGIWSIAFSPDGNLLVTGNEEDGTVRLWDAKTGQEIRGFATNHKYSIRTVGFSPDGKLIVTTGSKDGTIQLWDVATGQQVLLLGVDGIVAFQIIIGQVAFSPDGKMIAVVGTYAPDMLLTGGYVQLWELPH